MDVWLPDEISDHTKTSTGEPHLNFFKLLNAHCTVITCLQGD